MPVNRLIIFKHTYLSPSLHLEGTASLTDCVSSQLLTSSTNFLAAALMESSTPLSTSEQLQLPSASQVPESESQSDTKSRAETSAQFTCGLSLNPARGAAGSVLAKEAEDATPEPDGLGRGGEAGANQGGDEDNEG
jgi:hypothetical protein